MICNLILMPENGSADRCLAIQTIALVNFLYTAWLRDSEKNNGYPHVDWPIFVVIDALSKQQAMEWGDHLVQQKLVALGQGNFLFSSAETADSWPAQRIATVPRVKYGNRMPENTIGW